MNFEREEVLKIGEVEGKTLLDIGAGPLANIATRDFNCQVTNIDISERALREAKAEASTEVRRKIRFEKEDATALSYPDNAFDIVVSYGTLHHVAVEKREDFIEEANRAAIEKVIIVELNPAFFEEVHSKDPYQVVNLSWLEKKLSGLGKVEKYQGEERTIFLLSENINSTLKTRKENGG